ncbi:unnamed protein product [Caenorhabditis auriculariae]|uniref:Methylosome subunit pICln n=1 Tax=Caenorhabditis auriculariae TaxID=2777116 RepID=A0A8S1HEX8_9PELO|nr:unnamed protein product [Caenorhabditis auriculariae]
MTTLTNVSIPEEGVRLTQPHVQAYIGSQSLGNGTLIISERAVTWTLTSAQSGDHSAQGFELSYPSIVLHATSTDRSNFPEEHIYIVVDGNKSERRRRRVPLLLTNEEEAARRALQVESEEMNEDEDDDDSEAGRSIEVRFVPDDKSSLSQIYHEVCVGQELNPEEDDDMSDDEGLECDEVSNGHDLQVNGSDGHWYTAENMDGVELSEEGMANLQRMMGGRRDDSDDEQIEQ